MTGKTYILLFLSFSYGITAMAQATNRQKVVSMLLAESRLKVHINRYYHSELLIADVPGCSSIMLTAAINPIPRYALPKGNIICRFEDYVQMHTPMKLNIGVGGQ